MVKTERDTHTGISPFSVRSKIPQDSFPPFPFFPKEENGVLTFGKSTSSFPAFSRGKCEMCGSSFKFA